MFRTVLLRGLAALMLSFPPAAGLAQSGDALRNAFAAADVGDWAMAGTIAGAAGPVAADLIEWDRLRSGEGSFADALVFLARRPTWPALDDIRATAERAIPPETPAEDVIAFFDGTDLPETGAGVLALARALEAAGRVGEAEALVVQSWLTMAMEDDEEAALLLAYRDLLAPHHADRVDMLLWRWRRSDADRLLPLLDSDARAVAEARIALIRGDATALDRAARLPEALQDSPGLRYDRYSRLASSGQRTAAVELLTEASVSAQALGQPFRWSGWRRVLARWLLDEGEAGQAYTLAARHWLTGADGVAFADLEWLAGWIALRHLDQPQVALVHFQALEQAVDGPISSARAHYWTGRAQEALDNSSAALAAYDAGAAHQTAFYGLLSAERLGRPLDPAFAADGPDGDWQTAEVMDLDTVEAAFLLLAAGERGKAVLFFRELGSVLEGGQLASLGQRLMADEEAYFALLLGKYAAARGQVLPVLLHPVHPLAERDLPVEPALALAVARQESEFRADAGSPVGALGLMQLMPATAQEVAGELGLSYSRGRLTSDWTYNATLGSRYLANLEETFGPSPVMIAAGYNAGPSRPRIWMSEHGDPRTGAVDVVDWIESIPFTETRNYVMRVTEAIPVYRARLSGQAGQIGFEALLRGQRPLIRPKLRPQAARIDEATAEPPAPGAMARSLRPVARPGG